MNVEKEKEKDTKKQAKKEEISTIRQEDVEQTIKEQEDVEEDKLEGFL
jgi:hypothetical protein